MLKKILLISSLTALAIGAFNHATAPQWDVGLPLGTILLIVFYVVTVLEKEVALYDAEQRHEPAAGGPTPATPSATNHHYLTASQAHSSQ